MTADSISFTDKLLSSNSGGNTAAPGNLCQRNDINAQVFCALQQDYLWYRDLPAY
jgi:hypothetical protein